MTTEMHPGKGRVSVYWKSAAGVLMELLVAFSAFIEHRESCRTCNGPSRLAGCTPGTDLHNEAVKALQHANTMVQRAKETSS